MQAITLSPKSVKCRITSLSLCLTINNLGDLTMSTLTDKAWESLQNDETVFEVGVCTFNGCNVKVNRKVRFQIQFFDHSLTQCDTVRHYGTDML